jgi:hypothetical protein
MKSKFVWKEVGESVARDLKRIAIAGVLATAIACADATGPVPAVRITPAESSVALQTTPQGKALNTSVLVTNNSNFVVAVGGCGMTLEKAGTPSSPPGKSDWSTVWTKICYLLDALAGQSTASPGIAPWYDYYATVNPGQTVSLPISAVVGDPTAPSFTGEPGEYRVRVPLAMHMLNAFRTASPEQSVSDPFTIIPSP